ncbi:phosphate signaling complex PhoU family protein [Pyrodictium occultum]|uniref:phosphate signaling complex PhoU family protein n=1 Tax=Pyrodictium occultum TaxID=2309 RepID=UPI0022A8E168|nr:phosphate uptake regulator PhoU [Pyrodictium occultum]
MQVTGGGSYVVTLPKEWIRLHGIGKGSEVLMRLEPDGSLRLAPAGGRQRRPVTARIKVEEGWSFWQIVRRVISHYIAGADIIEVVFGSAPGPQIARQLRGFIGSRLIGVEVVEESSSSIVLQVIADTASLPLETSLRRLIKTVEFMLEDVITGLRRSLRDVLVEVEERDDVVDKFYMFISRQLTSVLAGYRLPSEIGLSSLADASIIMMAAKHLERSGDHVSRIASTAIELLNHGIDFSRGCLAPLPGHLEEIAEQYRLATSTFLEPSPSRADEGIEKGMEIRRRNEELLKTINCDREWEHKPIVVALVRNIIESSKRLVDYSIDLLELSLNRSILHELLGEGLRGQEGA